MQSLCSAQLTEKHLWGEGIGFEDDIFLTNEEWITMSESDDKMIVGLPGHAIHIASKTSYAWGAGTVSGFEKPAHFNSESTEYVAIAISGYNGAYRNAAGILAAKNAAGTRPDGTAWVWPKNICPTRIYIGRKGYDAKGNRASDFLSRNGLAFGHVYGFSVDSTAEGFANRDAWHQVHYNGDKLEGKFYPIDWRWDGEVRNFDHDGAWHFQIPPKGAPAEYTFWNAKGNDESGSKTEHVSPDPHGATAFYQTSTAGYFGRYEITGMAEALAAAANGGADPFPSEFDAIYSLYQGETPVNDLIDLGSESKGKTANGMDQTTMCDSSQHDKNSCGEKAVEGKLTFEDIDGFEAFATAGGGTFSIIQEDGGNNFGERMFIYENLLTYGQSPSSKPFKLVSQSGGALNSRMLAGVGVPAGVNSGAAGHEFSGVADLSGLLRKQNGAFVLKASDAGHRMQAAARAVPIGDKLLLIGLQAHGFAGGIISDFKADRGGQWLIYQPRMEGTGILPTETAGETARYPCNPFSSMMCHIHPKYKAELDAACCSMTTDKAADMVSQVSLQYIQSHCKGDPFPEARASTTVGNEDTQIDQAVLASPAWTAIAAVVLRLAYL
jgi:hypothetical protein